MKLTEIPILGEHWSVYEGTEEEYPQLKDSDGCADSSIRAIFIDRTILERNDPSQKRNLRAYRKEVLRHEVVHAFLYESGLGANSNTAEHWAVDEEIVDWIALQLPKIVAVCKKLEVMEEEKNEVSGH